MKTVKPKLLSCRACLATDVKLNNIHENGLAEAFSHVTGTAVLALDGCPQHLCVYCCATLRKCMSFRAKCLRAQQCFAQSLPHERTANFIKTIDRPSHHLLLNLTSHKLYEIDIDNTESLKVEKIKKEDENFKNRLEPNDFKTEIEIKDQDDVDHLSVENNDDVDNNDSSELIIVATSPVAAVKKKRRVRKKKSVTEGVTKKIAKRKKDNDYLPDFDFAKFESSYNVEIVILTKEQQLEEIALRKASNEHEFKCPVCGKGYLAEEAYNNHMARHSPSFGAHACEVCGVRFARNNRRQGHQDLHRLKFLCNACGFVSRNRVQARQHFQGHSGETHPCKHCDAIFRNKTSCFTHMRLQHPAANVACAQCGETFLGRRGLLQHIARAHRQTASAASESKCASCGLQFGSRDALARHADLGCDPDMRPCLVCGESLSSEELLQSHIQERHDTGQFKCLECNQTFANASSYDVHYKRIHLNVLWRQTGAKRARAAWQPRGRRAADARQTRRDEKPESRSMVCEFCGLKCQSACHLRSHRRRHTGERPYKCAECPKAFSLPQSLEWHQLTHSGERPHQCPQCERAFGVAGNLKRHINIVHLGQKHHHIQCPVCDKVYATKAVLKLHISTVHDKMPAPPRKKRKK